VILLIFFLIVKLFLGAKAIYITDYLEDLLPQLAKDIQTKYPKVTIIPRKVDAASEDDVKSVIDDAIKKFGRLDVFFANAG
jgi:NAD(P)-dependent dehydrogenase (short-subunit alcohol dehydrogenase family)